MPYFKNYGQYTISDRTDEITDDCKHKGHFIFSILHGDKHNKRYSIWIGTVFNPFPLCILLFWKQNESMNRKHKV